MPTAWLITRESEDAASDRAALLALGLRAVELPCLETHFLPWPWTQPAPLTLFTSRRTVEAWRRAGGPPLEQAAAMAPSTRDALSALGIPVSVSAPGGVVALASALVSAWDAEGNAPPLVHYPVSNAGLHAPEQDEALHLLGARTRVDRRVVYEVRAPVELPRQIADATHTDWAAIFASPSAVFHFFGALTTPDAPRHVLCLGGSTARAWDAARRSGWPAATLTDNLRRTLEELTP